jgi:hypothetical protein
MNEDISMKRNGRGLRTGEESLDVTGFEVSLTQIRFMAENKSRNIVMVSPNEVFVSGNISRSANAATNQKITLRLMYKNIYDTSQLVNTIYGFQILLTCM